MKSNELKKGDWVMLKGTGWKAEIADNKRGNIRMATVHGFFTEMGSIYVHDIAYAYEVGGKRGQWEIELTPAQAKLKKTVAAMGF
mgnify:CR=1 FL=1|jgi:hypothetical protein|tara:strand:+ start:1771 stop:2025 length:255 start_codon:yes stop_codon:yes gene_type:complete